MQSEKYKLTASSQNEDQSPSNVVAGVRESNCCSACKADVQTSINLIHGPPDEIYDQCARTNNCPAGLDSFREELKTAKIHLDRLTATIALLETERARLKGIVEKYSVILHPMRSISPDALQSILKSCVEQSEREEPKSSLVPSGMPWVLGQVCRYWRSTALSMPHLWTSITLDIDSVKVPQLQIKLLGLQIYRSQNLPLTVTIHCKLRGDYSSHPLVVLICTRSQQWRSLRLGGSEDVLRPISLVRELLPILESMTVDSSPTSRPGEVCLEPAPALRSVTLHGSTSIKLPWHQIKYFQLRQGSIPTSTNIDRVWTVLAQLSNVEVGDLYIDNIVGHPATFSSPRPSFNHLTTLIISSGTRNSAATGFIERITTPSLKQLKITAPYSGWRELLQLITRSSCRLTELSIREAVLNSESQYMLNLLGTLWDLTSLELGIVSVSPGRSIDDLFFLFQLKVVPRLEKLTIILSPFFRSSLSEDILLNALEYRWNLHEELEINGLRIVTLEMHFYNPKSRSRLEALRAQGLVVVTKDNN
ncbi:hypothetical protein WG66_006719 [Moniliophthora roreri]|nr:hypothetical protein WG66_006719 [Moniliophthora roreri]